MLTAENYKKDGNLHYKNRDYNSAIKSYTKAISLNNSEPIYYTNRAKSYINLKNFSKAIKDAEFAIEIDEKTIKAHFIIGKCLCEIGRRLKDSKKIDTAIKRYKKAKSLCSSQNKKNFEKEISENILRAKKLKFYIEKIIYEKEAKEKYEELLKKIENDININENEKNEYLEDLKKFFKFDYKKNKEIPNEFICPISNKLMMNPFITKYGNTYEEFFIKDFVMKNNKDFLEEKILKVDEIYPNLNMRHAVEDFVDENSWAFEYDEEDCIENILIK